VQLTLVAMTGIALGTALASCACPAKVVVMPAAFYVNTLRSIPLVMVILWFFLLIPLLVGRPMGAEVSAIITFTIFEAAYYSRSCAPASERAQGPGVCRLRGRYHPQQCMQLIVLPQVPQHAAGAADADHHLFRTPRWSTRLVPMIC
jgi:glutamate/aspartate transport system permease protein